MFSLLGRFPQSARISRSGRGVEGSRREILRCDPVAPPAREAKHDAMKILRTRRTHPSPTTRNGEAVARDAGLPRGRPLLAGLLVLAAALLALAPAALAAETRTYLKNQSYGPAGGAGNEGPANHYPETVSVSGVPGTVTKVTLTVVDLFATADLDMALVGPNGAKVMLMSDACASGAANAANWTFDDAGFAFVNPGSCPAGSRALVKPTNFGPPDDDDLTVAGGPTGPFGNSLAAFNGISPNGDWKLFMFDDNPVAQGWGMPAFALNLEIEPPPPTIVTVQVPVPVPAKAAKTGKRARALAKCKSKPTKQARERCRANARKQPV